MKLLRIYADTSVIGGCLDPEFAEDSRRLLDLAKQGKILLLASDILIAELASAPSEVQAILPALPSSWVEKVELNSEVIALRDAYLAASKFRLKREYCDSGPLLQ